MREIKFRAWNKEKNIMCYDNQDYSADYLDGIFSSRVGLINYWLSADRLAASYADSGHVEDLQERILSEQQ